MENIRRLLEITEAERNQELLLMARNLQELPSCAFPYIIPVVPRSLPTELIEGEHFVLADLCKSSLGSSSKAIAAQEDQAGVILGTLVRSVRVTQPQSPRLAPRPGKKKKGDRTRARQTKVAEAGLEDFVDWTCIIASEPAEEEEMSRLATRFATQMRKQAAGSEGETTPISYRKHPKRSSSHEEAQKD